MLDTDHFAYVLRFLRLAGPDVEAITARNGDRSPTRNNQIDAAFMALLIRYAEGNRGGPKHFSSATVLPNIYFAPKWFQFLSGGL